MNGEQTAVMDMEESQSEKHVFIEKDSIFDKKDCATLDPNPLITPYREIIREEIEKWLKNLEDYADLLWLTDPDIVKGYYIRLVNNHLEIGFVNTKFFR